MSSGTKKGEADFFGNAKRQLHLSGDFVDCFLEIRGQQFYMYNTKREGMNRGKKVISCFVIGSDLKVNVIRQENGVDLKQVYGKEVFRFRIFCAKNEQFKRKYVFEVPNRKTRIAWVAKLISLTSKMERSFKSAIRKDDEIDVEYKSLYGDKEITTRDFEELMVIGRGSFGKVVKVKMNGTNKIFALKILKKEDVVRENMIHHVVGERHILAQVDHPFIVSLHYAFQSNDKLYLVLDFLPGGELFYHLKEEKKFSIKKARFYAAEIVMAIGHLHKNKIIYRDLKPENIVLDAKGHIKLTDFGLAKRNMGINDTTSTFCGTPEYLAPEILSDIDHNKAVDWWSLGILLYEMITGVPPFFMEKSTNPKDEYKCDENYFENVNQMYDMICKDEVKFPKSLKEKHPDAVDILKELLKKNPKERIGSGIDDCEEIMKHPFFKKIDFKKLYNRKIKPPYVPDPKNDDMCYFDDSILREESSEHIKTNSEPVTPQQQKEFENFEFTKISEEERILLNKPDN